MIYRIPQQVVCPKCHWTGMYSPDDKFNGPVIDHEWNPGCPVCWRNWLRENIPSLVFVSDLKKGEPKL